MNGVLSEKGEIRLTSRIVQALQFGPEPAPGVGARGIGLAARPRDATESFHFFRRTNLGRRNLVFDFQTPIQIHNMFLQYGGAQYVGIWEGDKEKVPGPVVAGMPVFSALDSDDKVVERLSPFWWLGMGAGTQAANIDFGRLGKTFAAGNMYVAGANNSGTLFDLTLSFAFSSG